MPTFPDHILKHAPWAISKVGALVTCTQQFVYKYVDKAEEGPKAVESDLGISVHSVLEKTLAGVPIQEAFDLVGSQKNLTSTEIEALSTYYDQVEKFTAKMVEWKNKYGVHPDHVFIERKWGIKPDFSSTSFFDKKGLFRGVLDYGFITSSNQMVIIDHKSGKRKDLSEFEAQCKSYCLLALAVYPNLAGVRTGIHYVRTGELDFNSYVPAETIRGEYREWFTKYLTTSCEGLLFPAKPTKSRLCHWCSYKHICPAHNGTTSGKPETEPG